MHDAEIMLGGPVSAPGLGAIGLLSVQMGTLEEDPQRAVKVVLGCGRQA